jgi:hypothetical protein
MRMTTMFAAAAVAAGLALSVSGASAAPISNAFTGMKSGAAALAPVEAVSYGCWWRHGVRYCRRSVPSFGFYIGPPRRYGHYGHYGYRRF